MTASNKFVPPPLSLRPLALALTSVLLCMGLPVHADVTVTSGPMPGHSAMRSVQVWLQVSAEAQVNLAYWPAHAVDSVSRTAPQRALASEQYTLQFAVNDLMPGTRYNYRVEINGQAAVVPGPLAFGTQPLWQWRAEPPDFRVALGSCAYINDAPFDRPGKPYGDGYQIFDTIAQQQPDMMLWLGDNVYFREADYDSAWGLAQRYRQVRASPALQTLLRATHHYAIWDDHDYGPNNANHSYPLKGESLTLFRRYWSNPSYGLPELPGTFTQFAFHDVEFFLLDDRYYRHSDGEPDDPDKTLFGAAQLQWLRSALHASQATFKIVANGGQLFNDYNRFEGWNHFPHERNAFLGWLAESGVSGVVFAGGDRHHTELLEVEWSGPYPLYELTCSPMTSGVHDIAAEAEKPNLVPGTLVGERNFCRFDFSGPRSARRLTISSYDVQGKQLWEHKLESRELSAVKP